jgi:aminoglycoside phosphotransferase (APT) family kinase protein
MKMHDGEVDLDAGLVGRLVAAHFPALGRLLVRPVRSTGTVNAIYRIGDQLYARMPRLARWAEGLEREASTGYLTRIAGCKYRNLAEPGPERQNGRVCSADFL